MNRTLVLGALIALGAVLPAAAADWTLDPALTLQAHYNDSPLYITQAETQTEMFWLASAELKFEGKTPRSTTGLNWTPSYERDTDLTTLSHVDHFTMAGWSFEVSPRATWDALASWARTERQRPDFETSGPAQVALPRTTITTLLGAFAGVAKPSERTRWTLRADIADTSYEVLEEAPPDAPPPPEDSSDLRVNVIWERQVSKLTALGVEYYGSPNDEGLPGSWCANRLLGVLRWGSAERVEWTFLLGAGTPCVIDPPASGTLDESTNIVGKLSVPGRVSRHSDLNAGVRRDIAGAVQGAAIDETLYASWTPRSTGYSELRFLGRSSSLDPISDDPTLAQTKTKGLRGEWAPALGPKWHLVFPGETVDQNAEGSDPTLDGSYTILGAGVRWSPLARER